MEKGNVAQERPTRVSVLTPLLQTDALHYRNTRSLMRCTGYRMSMLRCWRMCLLKGARSPQAAAFTAFDGHSRREQSYQQAPIQGGTIKRSTYNNCSCTVPPALHGRSGQKPPSPARVQSRFVTALNAQIRPGWLDGRPNTWISDDQDD